MKRHTVIGGLLAAPALLVSMPTQASSGPVATAAAPKRVLVMGLGTQGHKLVSAWCAQLDDARRDEFRVFSDPFEEGVDELDRAARAAEIMSRFEPNEIRDTWLVFGLGALPAATWPNKLPVP